MHLAWSRKGCCKDVEYTGTASGDLVSNVTVGDTVGAGVVDGATITLMLQWILVLKQVSLLTA